MWLGAQTMPRSQARDRSVVLHTEKKEATLTVRQTDHGLNEGIVVEGSLRCALELDSQGLARRNHLGQITERHTTILMHSYGSRKSVAY